MTKTSQTKPSNLVKNPSLEEPFPQDWLLSLLHQKSTWWMLALPLKLFESLHAKSNHSSNNPLLQALAAPSSSIRWQFSEAWQTWLKSPKNLFDYLDKHNQKVLSTQIERAFILPSKSPRFLLKILTLRDGEQDFVVDLHCGIANDEIRLWAECVCLKGVSFSNESGELIDSDRFRFIYERQQLLEEQNKVIKRAFQKQSRFLALLSHELRSPLLGLQAMSKRLALKYPDTPELQNSFTAMSSTVEYLSYLMNDILTYSQTEFNSVQLYPHEFFIEPLLLDIKMLTEDIAAQKNLQVIVEFIGKGQAVFGDRVRLKQVLMNLVVNSIKFTYTGQITLCAEQLDNGRCHFKVIDTGEGISEEKLKGIFEPFIQLDSTTLGNQFGAGLGLFVVKELIELMGGEIKVVSALGKGTEFSFTLDLHERPVQSQSALNVEQEAPVTSSDFIGEHDKDVLDFFEEKDFIRFDSVDKKRSQEHGQKSNKYQGEDRRRITNDQENQQLDDTSNDNDQRNSQAFEATIEDSLRADFDLLATDDHISLKKVSTSDSAIEKVNTQTPNSETLPPAVKVLIAEDSDLNRWVLVDLLSEFGCDITETVNGEEAWHAYQFGEFDLVLLDIQMPILSGIDVARNIRRTAHNQKKLKAVVAITAGVSGGLFDKNDEAVASLFSSWMVKPMGLEKLKTVFTEKGLPIRGSAQSVIHKWDDNDYQLSLEDLEHALSKSHSSNQEQRIDDQQDESPAPENLESKALLTLKVDDYSVIPVHFRALFNDFVKQTMELIAEIERYNEAHHWNEVASTAHKLKGNMMLFHLQEAVTWLKSLEHTANSEENPDFKQETCIEVCQNLRFLIKTLEKSHSMINN